MPRERLSSPGSPGSLYPNYSKCTVATATLPQVVWLCALAPRSKPPTPCVRDDLNMTSMLNLEAIEHELLDGRTKGFPYGIPPIRLADVGKQGWRLLDGALPFPQAVIKDSALA